MLKKVKVVMLATNEKAQHWTKELIWGVNKGVIDYKLMLQKGISSACEQMGYNPQHLYFLSDEEIKEGDWYYSSEIGFSGGVSQYKGGIKLTSWKKIIATTDSSLEYSFGKTASFELPHPSESFLEVFVREYNKGNVIKEVMVEYGEIEYGHVDDYSQPHGFETQLKVNSKDNTITIKRVKESWNREEIIQLFRDHHKTFSTKHEAFSKLLWIQSNEWIEQNL